MIRMLKYNNGYNSSGVYTPKYNKLIRMFIISLLYFYEAYCAAYFSK